MNVGYAQRKQATRNCTMYVLPDVTEFPPMNGTKTYGYVVNAEGEHVYDGPFTVKCELPYTDYSRMLGGGQSLTASAHFNATANFTNGLLDGAYKSDRTVMVNYSSYGQSLKIDVNGSFTGAYVKGDPHGPFNMQLNGSMEGRSVSSQIKVNYKNGILVGDFYYSHDDVYTGKLTDDGKLTGTWSINGREVIFNNGVRVSETKEGKSTKPAIVEMSKKYAAGQISEKDLLNEGYIVLTSEYKLGGCVASLILEYFECDAIDGRDFGPKGVAFQHLAEVARFTDAGVDAIIKYICNYYSTGNLDSSILAVNTYGVDASDKYNCIKTDEKGRTYIPMNSVNGTYVVGASEGNVFILESQLKRIEEAVEKHIKEKCLTTLVEAIKENTKSKRLKAYLLGNKAEWNIEAENKKTAQAGTTTYVDPIKAMKDYNDATTAALVRIYRQLMKEVDNYKQNKQQCPTIEGYYTWGHTFVAQSSEPEVEKILNDVKSEIIKSGLDFAVKYIQISKKPLSICYSEYTEQVFYSTSGLSYWALELEKRLKKFGKISDFEFVSADEKEVVLNIKVFGKKKTIITYQLSIPHKKGKLHAESFDIEKAKIIE